MKVCSLMKVCAAAKFLECGGCSIENVRDLLDVDAFLDDSKVVIGDGADDGGESSTDSAAEPIDDGSHDGARGGCQPKVDAEAGDDEQERQSIKFPAMTLGQVPASAQACPGSEPLHNAGRHRDKPHPVEDQARDDREDH